MLAGNQPSHAAPTAAESTEGETEHFWYRLAPDRPFIDSQRDNKAFGFGDDKAFLSEDNGRTWPHTSSTSMVFGPSWL